MEKITLSNEQRTELQKIEVNILLEVDRICRLHNITYTLAYGTLLGAVRHQGFIPWDDDVDICMRRKDYEKFKCVCKNELKECYFYQSNETDPEYFHVFNKIRVNGTIFRETFLDEYNIHHGVYIDIFPVDNLADNKIKGFLQYYLFYFFRTGLMAKYMNIIARNGGKKFFMQVMRILFCFVSVEKLYSISNRIARWCEDENTRNVHYFGSAYRKKDVFEVEMYSSTVKLQFEKHEFPAPEKYDDMLKSIYGKYMKMPSKDKQITRHDLTEICLK